jgi:tRNA (mo5U34)-methyltransferase
MRRNSPVPQSLPALPGRGIKVEHEWSLAAMPAATENEIREAYELVLGRPADPAGLKAYLEQACADGITSGQLLHILMASDEFQARPAEVREQVREKVAQRSHPADAIRWFHQFTFPDGYVTSIPADAVVCGRGHEDLVFTYSVEGKTVLDIGAWDGLLSFAAEQRGAKDVLSTDWFCWGGPGWGTKDGYDLAHKMFNSRCRSLEVDVFELDPGQHGTFDVVLLLGVLYHLKDPFGGLERAAAMCRDHLIVETMTKACEISNPIMEFTPNLEGDGTNFWIPNTACLGAMLNYLGFPRIEVMKHRDTIHGTQRRVVHAWR